jgi:hypothetical protein
VSSVCNELNEHMEHTHVFFLMNWQFTVQLDRYCDWYFGLNGDAEVEGTLTMFFSTTT